MSKITFTNPTTELDTNPLLAPLAHRVMKKGGPLFHIIITEINHSSEIRNWVVNSTESPEFVFPTGDANLDLGKQYVYHINTDWVEGVFTTWEHLDYHHYELVTGGFVTKCWYKNELVYEEIIETTPLCESYSISLPKQNFEFGITFDLHTSMDVIKSTVNESIPREVVSSFLASISITV